MTVPVDQDPLIGTKVGPCRIELRLASGGMGVVYRANHGPTGQEVAVKILAPSLAGDQEYVTRFFREAGAAGQIDHPNVVRVIDVGRHQDLYYLVMQYVAGDTLDRMLDIERRMSLEKATRLIRGVTSGLAAAHRAGIIHRDVKPGNIIVSRDGLPHLTDFGLARHAETRKGLTIDGTFLGTPEYSSPEQVEGKKLDHRTDLYSLGVTYYQLLSGSLPFMGESPMEMAIKRTKEDPRPLEHALPTADPRACAIVRKLLQREAPQRYQSAAEVMRDFDAILTGKDPEKAGAASEESRKVRGPVLSVEAKRRIRTFIHWGLVALSVVLGLFSGTLAPSGRFLETWPGGDPLFGTRFMLAALAVLSAAGGGFIYRRELVYSGRFWALLLLLPLMLLGGLATGALLGHARQPGALGTIGSAFRFLGGSATEPANLLALGVFLIFVSSLYSYSRDWTPLRVWACRLALLTGFTLIYAFAATGLGLKAAPANFVQETTVSIPLATGSVLAVIFGILLVTGRYYEAGAKTFGAFLCVAAAAGLYAFVRLVSQPQRKGWAEALLEPLPPAGRAFLHQGTALLVVLALGVMAGRVILAGIRRQDRFYRKK